MRKRLVVLTSALGLAAALLAPAAANAAAHQRTVTVLTNLGSVSGSGMVYAELEVAEHYNKLGIPQELVDVPIAAIAVNGGGTQPLQIPVTREVLKHTSSGYADYVFWAVFGNHEATSEESLGSSGRSSSSARSGMSTRRARMSGGQRETRMAGARTTGTVSPRWTLMADITVRIGAMPPTMMRQPRSIT
jgi:hypothetical protein